MIYAYTFCRESLIRPDGVRIPDNGIEQYDTNRPLELCRHGYHASVDILDALKYAPGPILRRVRCSGEIIKQNDKLVCRRRTEIWRYDCTRVLRLWACWCTRRALQRERDAGREPDPRSWVAVDVAERYAHGKATNDELSAAYSAARDAAYSAAGSAAYSAAESAAKYTAKYAAYSAAWYAAYSATWDAAWDAERDIQRTQLLKMIDDDRKQK